MKSVPISKSQKPTGGASKSVGGIINTPFVDRIMVGGKLGGKK